VKPLKAAVYRWISQKYMAGCSNYNSLDVRKNSRTKRQAREMFARHGIPHARGRLFFSPLTAYRFAREHGFPLCIKPDVSGFSRGSHFPINNYRELWKAAFLVKVWWPTSVVEQYLSGANYRVLATPTDMISVIRRYPPFVDGNGKSTISELIDAENTLREEMGLYPTVHPIEKSSATRHYLARQGLSLSSVPGAEKRIQLFNRIALAPGGVVETIDQNTIPAANRALFLSIVKAFDASLFGIDVIFEKGIDTDYRQQACIFLEVNSRPYTRMHTVPRYGKVDDLDSFYSEMEALTVTDTDTF